MQKCRTMTALREQLIKDFLEYAERQTAFGPNDDGNSIKDAFAGVGGAKSVLLAFIWTGNDHQDAKRLVEDLATARREFKTLWDDEVGVGGAPFNWLRSRAAQLSGLPQPECEE